jgi:hypothetical protein
MCRRSARSSRQQNEWARAQGRREASPVAVRKVRETPKKKPVKKVRELVGRRKDL